MPSEEEHLRIGGIPVVRYTNEFWTAGQRQASSLHEISYRACFKPQLPRFFIRILTEEGNLVYDPFAGRGTTVIEAGLLGRKVMSNDTNPLSCILTRPRFFIPALREVEARLEEIRGEGDADPGMDLSMFYHPETAAEIATLRSYLRERREHGNEDEVDAWIRMVATNRLTGHSPGFFSVYTLPPNQAISPERQTLINQRRRQSPEYRDTRNLILKKSKALLKTVSLEAMDRMREIGGSALFFSRDSRDTPGIPDESMQLTVTSPPFLDVVQYSKDNWLRCWFNALDPAEIEARLTVTRSLPEWSSVMGGTFRELFRITRPGGWVAFEVGEVRGGRLRLDEEVVPLGVGAGFSCKAILVNLQHFTKTSHIWGIGNNAAGTNTNRIVVFRKEG
ncbi:MAG: site-specific DNA-methyltransferase [Methanolinea sp.]|nr:site-specific DNA-methyltransferase [Methanolinea sp.]